MDNVYKSAILAALALGWIALASRNGLLSLIVWILWVAVVVSVVIHAVKKRKAKTAGAPVEAQPPSSPPLG